MREMRRTESRIKLRVFSSKTLVFAICRRSSNFKLDGYFYRFLPSHELSRKPPTVGGNTNTLHNSDIAASLRLMSDCIIMHANFPRTEIRK